MGRTYHELGVLAGGLLCGVAFMTIALAIAGALP